MVSNDVAFVRWRLGIDLGGVGGNIVAEMVINGGVVIHHPLS